MKVKILKSDELKSDDWYKDYVGTEFEVDGYHLTSSANLRVSVFNHGWIYSYDCVITELPESFCVKRCDDKEKWNKCIKWLNKTYESEFDGNHWEYYGIWENGFYCNDKPFGTEIHIDDMIKHIDYLETLNTKYVDANGEPFVVGAWYKLLNSPTVEYRKCCKLPNDDSLVYLECITGISVGKYFSSGAYGCTSSLYRLRRVEDSEVEKYLPKEEFDLTTLEGRLAYAEKYYPIGTKYKPLDCDGKVYYSRPEVNAAFKPIIWVSDDDSVNRGIEVSGVGLIYHEKTNRWAEIIKEEENMETQKLSRQGLKEIHSVACSSWKETLEQFGRRNPLEDYIELSQDEINIMFDACNKDQLPIVSKYLKQDDGSIDLTNVRTDSDSIWLGGCCIITPRRSSEYENKAFNLDDNFKWEIKKDSLGILCLIPTKKK